MFVLVFLLMSVLASHVHAQSEGLVGKIKIKGNKRVETSTLLYYIKTREGEPLSRNQISKDIEEIYGLGQFKDIRVETRRGLKGLEVVFIVEEIPSIGDIQLYGNKEIDDNDIYDALLFKRGEAFQEYMPSQAKEKIKSLYHERGFFLAKVDVVSKISNRNLINIHIRVIEGEKIRIKSLRFSGNKKISADKLRDQMETNQESWFSFLDESGIYKKDILKIDLLRLEAYYQDHGYLRATAQEPKIDIDKKNKEINILIPINEGSKYRVGKLTSKSDDRVSEEDILKAIQIKNGDIYSLAKVRQGILNVSDLYSERGFAFADVSPLTKINENTRTVDVSIEVERGRKTYVGEISMVGNTRTQDNVIRREFRLKEGELFDSVKLRRTKQRINNLQFFEDVKIDTSRGKEPDLIDITTTVTEKPTGSVNVGAGFSSTENLIFNAGISQNNFLGRGQRVVFSTNLSSRRTDFNLSLTDPRIFDTELSAGIDAFNRKTDYYSYKARNTGAGIRFGKSLSEHDWAGLNYNFSHTKITDVVKITSYLKNETRNTSRISPTFIRDTRDNFLNPSTGSRHVVRFGLAGLGGAKFHKMSYEGSRYWPIVGKLVGMVHGMIAWADGYADEDLPAFERYYMGGPKSLRGYTIRDVGPKDSEGNPLGGNQSLLLNLELQYPFTKGFRGFAFYDRGQLYGAGDNISSTSETWDLLDMRDSVGVGLRFMSPFGPIGFAYGLKLDQATGEESGEFHFSAGNSF
ncbi:MAG: outer membrane protein assembly factor BamA [Nitrospina sp.]|nr:outer membrane protein assembly factor BamA [Nitrospina sp.]MBT6601777.1 outer membrane protein assembly factor BamA [Nitrospina sp.]